MDEELTEGDPWWVGEDGFGWVDYQDADYDSGVTQARVPAACTRDDTDARSQDTPRPLSTTTLTMTNRLKPRHTCGGCAAFAA